MTGPVGLATELVEDRAVLLGLDEVGVGGLGGDEGRGEVPGSLRGGVPDVQLQTVLLLRRAARAVEFHGHPPNRWREDNLKRIMDMK